MSQVPSQKFGAEYVAHLRELLDIAAEEIGPEHRASATKAKITRTRIRNKDGLPEARHFTSAASTAGEDRTA
ncbi:conserved hypothetical protein [Nitrobacter winogradskyi Nb-255]|uniref:Uncharacterized protein n=1 Tax=Nitrobacter winogradskyi (strain ATCC 25391 / DSM 10237 / CIP 104748 / NCIMB 11846 / Nb-255) TaxID=323098 RepID=Q3SNC8_NITWN|nr:hypothetical protein [Nitrobacter winogradskyi]ABA06213.1 conserved hypothetical protein [Nitrobacter winogradskyi Nb-255]